MYVHRVEFSFTADVDPYDLSDSAMGYLAALSRNGQVLGEHWPLYRENDRLVSVVTVPEADSLDDKYESEYVKKGRAALAEKGIGVSVHVVGDEVASRECCQCTDSSGYVLFTTFLALTGLPVHCMDCFDPVPLYRFPGKTASQTEGLLGWEANYIACDTLDILSAVLEKSAIRQKADWGSALSKEGRRACKTFAKLTGKPFYYYLYRDRGTDAAAERERRCPSCGEAWLLDEPLHRLFDFRCDRCRLLSNIAWDLSGT